MNKKIAIITFLMVFLASCASSAAPQPTATPIPSSTLIPSATATSTPEPSPTATPTATETPMPVAVADYTPENTPQTFQHNGRWWNRTTNEAGKYVWKAVNEDGIAVEGMEYVTMEFTEMLLGNVNSMMVVYHLGSPESGEFNIAVSPHYQFFFDFGKSGQTMKQIGDQLRKAIVDKATDPEAKSLMQDGAPITVVMGQKEKVWDVQCARAVTNVPPLTSIDSPDGSVVRNYRCADGDGWRNWSPLIEIDGGISFGKMYSGNLIEQTNRNKSIDINRVGNGLDSPVAILAGAFLNGIIGENLEKNYGVNPGLKLSNNFSKLLDELLEVKWVE